MIVKKGDKWCVVSEDGSKNFGCYPTEKEAKARLAQVEFFKHQKEAYPNEHASRQNDPGKYKEFRRDTPKGVPEGIVFIYGILTEGGERKSEVQAIRFDKKKWSPEAAKKWLKDHDFKTTFEKAREKESFHIECISIQEASKDGSEWDVVLIEAGLSKNNKNYSPEMLERNVEKFDGVQAFAYEFKGSVVDLYEHLPDHVRERYPDGLPGNLVGWYENPRFGKFVKEDGSEGQGIIARFKVAANWLKEKMKNAWDKGKKDLLQFSIDGEGPVEEVVEGDKRYGNVLDFDKIDEVTVVTRAGAGGRALRLVASDKDKLKENIAMKEIIEWLRKYFPRLVESIKDDAEPEEMSKQVTEALGKIKEGYKEPGKSDDVGLTPVMVEAIVEKYLKNVNSEAAKISAARSMLETKVKESTLPPEFKKEVLDEYGEMKVAMTEDQINALLARRQATIATLVESGLFVPGQEQHVELKEDEYEKIQKRMDGMFAGENIDGIPRFRSLHESYRHITGFMGSPMEMGHKLLRETAVALPPPSFCDSFISPEEAYVEYKKKLRESEYHTNDAKRIKEATNLLTSTWTEVFGDSVRRQMMKIYSRPQLQDWRKICSTIGSAPDFRTNRRIRVGGFANLDAVSENGTYQYIDLPTDEEVSFAVTKRGNLYSVSFESMVNDDLGAVKRLINNIGMAAAQTLYEFVFDFVKDNGDMDYDSVALYHASSHGANLATTALADSSLDDRIFNMEQQTEQDSSKPLGIKPRYIMVPAELSRTAWEVTRSNVSLSGGRTETVDNWAKTFAIEPIEVYYWTDATDWYLVADPKLYPTIEILFLNGREEPEIFIQDQPTIGSVFTADKITVKIRHIYGGDVLDHRPFDGNVVSG